MKEKWCIVTDGGGLGDHIILISALRHFARQQNNIQVGVDNNSNLKQLASLYDDDLITYWLRTPESAQALWTTPENLAFEDKEVQWKVLNVTPLARDKTGIYINYHGVYLASLFNFIPYNVPNPELPKINNLQLK